MTEAKRFSLVKPTVDTPFHVDFEWWKKNERDWHVYLRSLLCAEHQEAFANVEEGETIDWVDPVTAEVKPVEGVQNALMTHCVKQADFLTSQTALVEAIFRLFLANGNMPMTSKELGSRLSRPADTILRTLAGGARVYKGIRPATS
ncbi:MAG: hypothetical protein QM730_21165 [Anaerolineales bacterium]